MINNIFKHIKSGGLYEVITHAFHEETDIPLVVYRSLGYGGRTWVRSLQEFNTKFKPHPDKMSELELFSEDFRWLKNLWNEWREYTKHTATFGAEEIGFLTWARNSPNKAWKDKELLNLLAIKSGE